MSVYVPKNLKKGEEMRLDPDKFAIVSGGQNPKLVDGVAKELGLEACFFDTTPWGNNYPRVMRPEKVSFNGKDVFIVTDLRYYKIGSPLEELQLLFHGCSSAHRTHIVITWVCFKDDVDHQPGSVPNGPWIAYTIKTLNPKSVTLFDQHQSVDSGMFFPVRTRRFYYSVELVERARMLGVNQISAADDSSGKRAKKIRACLGVETPIFSADKEHTNKETAGEISSHSVWGDYQGGTVGIFDDMALSLGTLKETSRKLKEIHQVKKVIGFAAHFDPTEKTLANLRECFDRGWLDYFVTTNSTQIDPVYTSLDQFEVVDVSGKIAEIISEIGLGKSTSGDFTDL